MLKHKGRKTKIIGWKLRMKPIGNERITKLGFTIDANLRFDYHGITLCKKVGRKVSALDRLVKFLTIEQWKPLLNPSLHTVRWYGSFVLKELIAG